MARTRRQSVGAISYPNVVFIMEPDEEELRHDLMLLSRQISDYNKPLRHSKEYIIEDTKKTFRLERDPVDGRKWDELSDRAARVPRYGILQRKQTRRAMYRSVTSKNSYGISKEGVWFNASRVPEYAGAHQQDERLPPPTFTKDTVYAAAKDIQAYRAQHGLKPLRGTELVRQAQEKLGLEHKSRMEEGKIPQRRFMGVSQLAQRQIQGTFDAWAQDAIIIYKRGGKLIKARRPRV